MREEGFDFREKAIYRLIGAGFLAGLALSCGERFFGIGSMDYWLGAEAAVILGLLTGVNFLPLKGKFLCLAAAVLGLGAVVSAAGAKEAVLFLRSYFPWLMGRGYYPEWSRAYDCLQTAVISFLCYLIQLGFEKIPRMKLIFTVFLVAGAAFALLSGGQIPHLGVVFGTGFVVTVYAEQAEAHWKKVKSGKKRAYMLRIMPFLAVYLLLIAAMPSPEEPYDWPWVRNVYSRLRETFLVYTRRIKWGGREGFGMSFSGFSQDGEVGGDLRETAEAVMTVEPLNITPLNLYLTGTVYDTFDGRQWLQMYSGDPEGVFLDTAETLCAAEGYGGKYRRDYLRSVKLRIRYQDFHTGCVFAPLKTWDIFGEDGVPGYTGEGGSLRFQERQGYGTEYELEYYQLNEGQEAFYRFLEACAEEKEGMPGEKAGAPSWEGAGAVSGQAAADDDPGMAVLGGREYTDEDMALHRREIDENYLGEVSLSEETAEYLAAITAGAGTAVEKLRAIERNLSSMKYTLTPGELPEWVEDERTFLDFFLLKSQEGYCTYFATAFVLLARAEGIPARYVQGYCVRAEESGETAVYSNMAHAWPEAYITGVGWIPFEPTPGYGEGRHTSWEMQQPSAMTEPVPVEDGAEIPEEEEAGDGEPAKETEGTEDAMESRTEAEEVRLDRFLRWAGYAVPMILAGYVLLLFLDNAWGRYRLGRMCPEEILKLEARRNLRVLALLGFERGEGETLQELHHRCRRHPVMAEASRQLGFITDYEEVVYGGRKADKEMIGDAVRERQELLELLKRKNRWAYIRWRMRASLVRYR